MIGGARSTKSPRDQAYIYFACFEGSAAGGYRERKRMRENGEKGRREEGQEDGRKEGLRASQQCGIWRVLVPSNSTRCSSAAGCIIQSVLARSRAYRATGLLFPFPPRPSFHPLFSRQRSTSSENASLSSLFLLRSPTGLSFVSSRHSSVSFTL